MQISVQYNILTYNENVEYKINTELNKVCEWLTTTKLFLNIINSKYILLQMENKKSICFAQDR